MNKRLMALMVVALAGSALAAPFGQGNLVVVRVGAAGGPSLNSAANAAFLEEYTPSGLLVQTIAMPTSTSGTNRRLTISGSATTEGTLTLSANGQYLTMGGYDADVGTAAIGTTTSANVNRVIGRIDSAGLVDTTTTTTAFSANSIRSVVSNDGSQFWSSGGNGGAQYSSALGGSTSTQVNNTGATNNRQLNIFNGQLYIASASGASRGINTIGTGLPTTPEAMTLLTGTGSITGTSPNDYYLSSGNVLYIADDSTTAGVGGLQKWELSAGVWSRTANFVPANGGRLRQMTGTTGNDGSTLLYITVIDSTGIPSIQSFTEAGGFTPIVTGVANTAWRGIDFAPIPTPGALSVLGMAGLLAARRRR